MQRNPYGDRGDLRSVSRLEFDCQEEGCTQRADFSVGRVGNFGPRSRINTYFCARHLPLDAKGSFQGEERAEPGDERFIAAYPFPA